MIKLELSVKQINKLAILISTHATSLMEELDLLKTITERMQFECHRQASKEKRDCEGPCSSSCDEEERDDEECEKEQDLRKLMIKLLNRVCEDRNDC